MYFLRHTKPIEYGTICYGQLDIEVTKASIQEAVDKMDPKFKSMKIISSPLKRCLHLTQKISDDFTIDNRIMEFNFGVFEGVLWKDIPREEIDSWSTNPEEFSFKDGESYLDLRYRVLSFLNEHKESDNTLVVTHAGVIKCCLDILHGVNIRDILFLEVPFGEVLELSNLIPR